MLSLVLSLERLHSFELLMSRLALLAPLVISFAVASQAAASSLEWFPCPNYANLSCSYFDIPLDYHNASAGSGQLLVVKANATTEREGTIFLNPGTPMHSI